MHSACLQAKSTYVLTRRNFTFPGAKQDYGHHPHRGEDGICNAHTRRRLYACAHVYDCIVDDKTVAIL